MNRNNGKPTPDIRGEKGRSGGSEASSIEKVTTWLRQQRVVILLSMLLKEPEKGTECTKPSAVFVVCVDADTRFAVFLPNEV